MSLALFFLPDVATGVLTPDDSRHALKSLRLQPGDEIEITDGRGNLFKAVLEASKKTEAAFSIIATATAPKRPFSIHLAIAPTKNIDRMEWMIEKSVEIGIEAIQFIRCQKSERKAINLDRLEKIAVSALKQSRQVWLPLIQPMTDFSSIITTSITNEKYIAVVDERNPLLLQQAARKGSSYLILIGPEGDFSSEEVSLAVQHEFKKVSLGPNRLRTETAGLAAVMTLNLVNQ